MASRIVQLNDLTFTDWTAKQPGVTVVAVRAAWCAQSRALTPVLEEVSAKYVGRARLAAVDYDESTEFVKRFNVTGVPAVMVFKHGEVVQTLRACTQLQSRTVEELIQRAV